jgi:hypothetical protein
MHTSTPRSTLALASGLCALALVSAGCGAGSNETTGGSTTGAGPAPDPAAIAFHVETTVKPGTEIQLCKFIALPKDRGELAVTSAEHTYTEGSHHFLVYRTSITEIPAGGEDLVSCDETEWMSKVSGVAYAAQSPTGNLTLPEGVSQRFTPGEVLLVQVHYVNASAADLDAKVDFTFHTSPADSAPTEAGVLFFFNPIIDVPPHGTSTAQLSCPIPEDVNLVFAASHMHKRGASFEAHLAGQPDGSLYTSKTWSEPVPQAFSPGDASAKIAKGSSISYACSYQNADDQRYLAGPSAQKDEMCMFIGMYYPKLDSATELCWNGAVKTTGTASCLDTLKCAGLCAAGDLDCRAKCLDAICPTAAEPMMRFGRCVGPACGEICKTKGAGSPECTSCATAKCLDEAVACQSAVCASP